MSKPCAYYFGIGGRAPGSCTKGASCPFSHDPASAVGARPPACEFHFGLNGRLLGTCSKGAACRYSHAEEDARRPLFDGPNEVRAAGILISRPGGLYYLVRDEQGWADPGGKIQFTDSSIEEAAAREFMEETELEPPPMGLAKKYYVPEAKYQVYSFFQNFKGGEDPTQAGKGAWMGVEGADLHPRLRLIMERLGKL